MSIRAVVLDVNETLFSLDAVRHRFERWGLDGRLLRRWFAEVLRDGFAVAAAGGFAPFPELARVHLEELGRTEGVDDVGGFAEDALGGFEEVAPHPDTTAGLRGLRDAGYRVVTFTNGTAAITRSFLERAGAADLVDHVLDVSGPALWKPHPAAYRWACDAVGVRTKEAAMVAVHAWDVQGAQRAGMTGCWVDRAGGTPWPTFLPEPDATVASLTEVAGALR